MKIIIAGAGGVGFHIAKLLSFESQDITLIDTNKADLQFADNTLDIRTLKGDATSIAILKEARVSNSDLLIAVTSSETTNITICVIAKQLGCKQTIARVSNSELIHNRDEVKFHQLGIDELISPDLLATHEIEILLNQSAFNDSFEFDGGALHLVGVLMPEKAPFVGKSVKDAAQLFPEMDFMPVAIQRNDTSEVIIPRGDTVFCPNDQVYFTTSEKGDKKIYPLLGRQREKLRSVMILGGSKVGVKTAKNLEGSDYKVKLIEIIKEKAHELADQLPEALIINGDGRNVDLLKRERLSDTDAFVAVTGDSETNVMACMIAKSKGVKKTIALIDNIEYNEIAKIIGIDTLINKKILAANSIFRYVWRGEIVALMRLGSTGTEILEFIVKPNSMVAHQCIRDIPFPREAIVGGVIRKGKGRIALGGFRIEPDDHVIVCCLPEVIREVDKLFF